MRKINTTFIIDPNVQQALTGPSIDFMTKNELELLSSICQFLLNDRSYFTTFVYVLYGCVRSGTADGGSGTTSITAGAVFIGGEIYQVPAFSGTMSGGNVLTSSIVLSPTTVDPIDNTRALDAVTFSDGSSKNVHITGILQPAIGPSAGAYDQVNWNYLNVPVTNIVGVQAPYHAGWSQFNRLSYTQDRNGFVTIEGDATATAATIGFGDSGSLFAQSVVVFQLPAGFRPKSYVYGVAMETSGNPSSSPYYKTSNVPLYMVIISPSGNVIITSISGGTYTGSVALSIPPFPTN